MSLTTVLQYPTAARGQRPPLSLLLRWRPLASHPAPARLPADYAAGAVQLAIAPVSAMATLISVPPDSTDPDPVNASWEALHAYSPVGGREPESADFLRAHPPQRCRLKGLWLIDWETAHDLFRDDRAQALYLFPIDPAALRQQVPGRLPDGDFFFELEWWHSLSRADVLFAESIPHPSSPPPPPKKPKPRVTERSYVHDEWRNCARAIQAERRATGYPPYPKSSLALEVIRHLGLHLSPETVRKKL